MAGGEIFCLPDERRVPVAKDQTLLDALLAAGVAVAHACGGHARCSTCRLQLLTGAESCTPRSPDERTMARRLGFDDSIRLACQTRITGDVAARRLILDDEDESLATQLMKENRGEAIGREIRAAILFADVAGFTALSEVLPPYDVIHLLNRFFHRAARAVERHGGRIDNYLGDGLLAVFGEEECPDAPLGAVKAGLDLLGEAAGISGYAESVYGRPFAVRVGIHYGTVVRGTVGDAKTRRDTIIGDPVNMASRIESAGKEAGTRFLVSEETWSAVRDRVEVGRTFPLKLRGKEGTFRLYEITGLRAAR
ncbi:MAG: adenylate/guanylate cyclase domain-containing protein [Planctomycetota bacterium]